MINMTYRLHCGPKLSPVYPVGKVYRNHRGFHASRKWLKRSLVGAPIAFRIHEGAALL